MEGCLKVGQQEHEECKRSTGNTFPAKADRMVTLHLSSSSTRVHRRGVADAHMKLVSLTATRYRGVSGLQQTYSVKTAAYKGAVLVRKRGCSTTEQLCMYNYQAHAT